MRILSITDLHGRLPALGRIFADAGSVDAVLLGGDITNFGSPIDADRVIQAVREKVPTVYAVAGNCDSASIDRRLAELGVSLHSRGVVLGNVGLHGLSGIPPWKKGMYELAEVVLADALQEGYKVACQAERRILLAHAPPRDTEADRTLFGTHVGSTAVREFVERTQPDLVFCGHIHEGRGVCQLGGTTVLNCGHGALGAYALAEVGDTIQVELRSA